MTDYQKQSPMQAIEVNNIKKSYVNKYALGQPGQPYSHDDNIRSP